MNKTNKHRSGKHSPYTRPRKRKDTDKAEKMLDLNTRKKGWGGTGKHDHSIQELFNFIKTPDIRIHRI